MGPKFGTHSWTWSLELGSQLMNLDLGLETGPEFGTHFCWSNVSDLHDFALSQDDRMIILVLGIVILQTRMIGANKKKMIFFF